MDRRALVMVVVVSQSFGYRMMDGDDGCEEATTTLKRQAWLGASLGTGGGSGAGTMATTTMAGGVGGW